MNLNRAMIIGNLTRDPEVRTTANGTSVCSLGVATNRTWTDPAGTKQEDVEFHNIVVWGKLADICGQYLGKGRKVYIEGRLKTREWQGKDGVKRQKTEIIAENMIMLDRGTGAPQGSFVPGANNKENQQPNVSGPMLSAAADQEIKVEDIPF